MNVPLTFDFTGPLDRAALIAACDGVVSRHPSLWRPVAERDAVSTDAVSTQVATEDRFRVEVKSWDANAWDRTDIDDLARKEILRPFGLEGGPLIRATLFSISRNHHLLLIVAHRIAFDDQSKDIFARELADSYNALIDNASISMLVHPDAAGEQLTGAEIEMARSYWRNRWPAGSELVLPGLNTPHPGAIYETGPGATVEPRYLGVRLAELGDAARALGVTRFEFVIGVVSALLSRYGNHGIPVGLELDTRDSDKRYCIGAFSNELPFAAPPTMDLSLGDFIRAVREGLRSLSMVRNVPLARAVPGVESIEVIAPVSASYRPQAVDPEFMGVTAVIDRTIFTGIAGNVLHFFFIEDGDTLFTSLRYNLELLRREDVTSVAQHLSALVEQAIVNPDGKVRDVQMLGSEERTMALSRWNATQAQLSERTVIDLFEQQAAQTPERVAVCSTEEQISYGELALRAARLAADLQEAGVQHESLVGIYARRSIELLVGMLATWKAGGAYIPLDPDYPRQRLQYMLENSGATALLVQEPLGELAAGGIPVFPFEENGVRGTKPVAVQATETGPESLAYVIYTSGSTGVPKGVCISHRSLANVLIGMQDQLVTEPDDCWLALTSPSFDISVLELVLPLIYGGRTVIAAQHAMWSVAALREFMEEYGVTHVQATPTGWRVLLAGGFEDRSVMALVGGEVLSRPLAQALRQRVGRLVNVYGPTETTVWSTAFEIEEVANEVPIGRPIANTQMYVLDDSLLPVPVGVPGELFIGGAGVARGYLRQPRLTAERFVPDPFGGCGNRLYRTGDRVLWGADGTLRFIGRVDNQVKLHGHRIELGELEARLVEHPAIDNAVAAIREGANGEPILVAYLVGTDLPEEASIMEFASAWLPPYMVPHSFVTLDRLPATPAGKVDRAALPAPA